MRVAVLNTGSATVKAALVDVGERVVVRRRGQRDVGGGGGLEEAVASALTDAGAFDEPFDAVGHRVVHGGTLVTSTRIDARVERAIEDAIPLAPRHNRPALDAIRFVSSRFPDRPAVAALDTEFHAARPEESMRYALPRDLDDERKFRRTGFHGLAHAALVEAVAAAEGTTPDAVDAVTLQLGGGCSACAVRGGRSIETSMGYSPLEGLPMATRSGDVDPSVVLALVEAGRSPAEVRDLSSRRSGWLGLAGDADFRAVLAAEARGDDRARVAVALLVRRLVLVTGAYLTLLGGSGAVVFGGGVGFGSADLRRRVAAGLGAWDVRLDDCRNESGEAGPIHAEGSRRLYALVTEEEPPIARRVREVLAGPA